VTTLAAPTDGLTGLQPKDLETLLQGLPHQVDDRQSAYNLSLVERLGKASSITALLQKYLDDNALLDTVAARSYPHVNHFDKIVLVDTGNQLGYRLTLHAWFPPYTEKEIQDELIHDHRFSFWSTILAGRLFSQNFARHEYAVDETRPRNPMSTYRQYQYSPEKLGDTTTSNFYEFIGKADLEMTGDTVETQGNAYHLKYYRIHRVVLPTESLTCTLVLRGPRERNFSNVYNTSYPDTDTQSGNVMFTRAELIQKLTKIMANINNSSSSV
jgi:hypothetical protein